MTKKLLIVLFQLLIGGLFFLPAQTFSVLDSIGSVPRGISADGKLIAGIDNDEFAQGYKSYIWNPSAPSFVWLTDVESEDPYDNNNGSIVAISNNGIAVGYFVDFINLNVVAGAWRNGERIHLGYGSLEGQEKVSSYATCIASDGNTIGGYLHQSVGAGLQNCIPCIWEYEEDTDSWKITELHVPFENSDSGFRITGISSDGKVMIGEILTSAVLEGQPLIFVDGDAKVLDMRGDCASLSENGRYIVIQTSFSEAVRYDLETETFISLPMFDDITQINNMHITNDGDVFGTVGYMKYANNMRYIPLRSFYFREKSGDGYQDRIVDFEFFIRNIAPDVELPDGISFRYEEEVYTYIQSVSADGRVIVGGTGNYTWVFDTGGKKAVIANTARSLDAKITDVREVAVTWKNAVFDAENAEYEVDYYRVYRDGELISDGENIELSDFINYKYVDKDVNPGNRDYSVSAVYRQREVTPPVIGGLMPLTVTEEDRLESPRTENFEIMVADNFDIPFFDNFDSWSFDTHYWTTGKTNKDWWGVVMELGIDGTCVANVSTDGVVHSKFLTTKHLDARGLENVYITYAEGCIPVGSNFTKDSLNVEISIDGENWETIKTYFYNSEENRGWIHEVIDISDLVTGEIFQVRFHAGGEGVSYTRWFLDWFSVTSQVETSAPVVIKGYVNEGKVKLGWTNSMGAYELSYMDTENYNFVDRKNYYINNESGDDLIIANAFDNYDLHIYDGMYLAAINAYLFGDSNTELELVVYENNMEIRRQPIVNFIPDAENTFVLEEPVIINSNYTLKYGIHVIKNRAESIFKYQNTPNAIPGKSDLYSVDNGKTWSTIYDAFAGSEDQEQRVCAWDLTANITAEPLAWDTQVNRDNNLVAYYIYRNGEMVNDSFYSYHRTYFITDDMEDAEYKVMAYYADGTLSEFSTGINVSELEDITGYYVSIQENPADDKIRIYPNPASEVIYISSDFNKASLININGQVVIETDKSKIDISAVPEGIYLLKVETSLGIIINKVIVKK